MKGFPYSPYHKIKGQDLFSYSASNAAGHPYLSFSFLLLSCLLIREYHLFTQETQTDFAHPKPLRDIPRASFVVETGQPATNRSRQLRLVRFAVF